MMDDVCPSTDLMLGMRPAHVVGASEAPIVAVGGVPALRVSKVGVPVHKEKGHAAVAYVRGIVSPWNPQHVQADVRAKVRGLSVFAHARKAHVAVHDERWRERQCMTNRDKLYKGMKVTQATIAVTVTNDLAKARLPVKHGFHSAVLGKKGVLGRLVPIHFAIKVISVQALRRGREIVGGIRRNTVHCHVRSWNQCNELRRDGINRDGSLIRKGLSSGAVSVPCCGVVDRRTCTGEVSRTKCCRRERLQTSPVITLERAVPTSKEKELVLEDWAAKSTAHVIQNALPFTWAVSCRLKELSCPQRLVLVVFKQASVELIRPGLGDNGDGRSTGHSLLGVEVIRRNVDLLNGLCRRNVNGMMREPYENVGRAVHTRVVVVSIRPVDVGAQTTFRCVRNRVLKDPGVAPGTRLINV